MVCESDCEFRVLASVGSRAHGDGVKCLVMLVGAFAAMSLLAVAVPAVDSVAVLYNSAIPDSAKLAEIYRRARGIPEENLIGLDMPQVPDISRADYDARIAAPLRAEFDRRGWWQRGRDRDGLIMPRSNKIRVLVTMRGDFGEFNPAQVPMGNATQTVLEAMGTLVHRADTPEDIAPTVNATIRLAFNTFRPTATLIGQRVLGAKTFGKD